MKLAPLPFLELNDMDRQQRIDHYLQRLSDKHFEIYDVRRELEQQNVDEEEIRIIVRAVDDELQTRLLRSSNPDHSAIFIRVGVILILIGAALGLTAVAGLVRDNDLFIFTYASFFTGVSVLVIGLFKRKNGRANDQHDKTEVMSEKRRVSFRKKSSG